MLGLAVWLLLSPLVLKQGGDLHRNQITQSSADPHTSIWTEESRHPGLFCSLTFIPFQFLIFMYCLSGMLPPLSAYRNTSVSPWLLFFPKPVLFLSQHSLCSSWACQHLLCLVRIVCPSLAMSSSRARLLHGHCRTRMSRAFRCSGMVVIQMASSPAWCELCWKHRDPNCQVGMWFGSPGFPCSQGLSPVRLWGVSFLLSRGWRPRSAFEDHCRGCHKRGSLVFLPQTSVVAGSPYLMGYADATTRLGP